MVRIASKDGLERWLRGKPREIIVAISSRNALRFLPFSWSEVESIENYHRMIAVFRANLISRLVSQVEHSKLQAAASAAGHSAATIAATATFFAKSAIDAAETSVSRAAKAASAAKAKGAATAKVEAANTAIAAARATNATAASASNAAFAAAAASAAAAACVGDDLQAAASAVASVVAVARSAYIEAIWKSVSDDATWYDKNKRPSAASLLRQPLWLEQPPSWFSQKLKQIKQIWETDEAGWSFLSDWYESRINGRSREWPLPAAEDRAMGRWILGKADRWWRKEDVSEINAAIAAKLSELKASVKKNIASKADFFISYSAKDQALADEVVGVLRLAGISTLSMADFGPGNFVGQIGAALTSTKNFVPLFTKAYFESDWCKAELTAAFNRDPSGDNWYIRALQGEACAVPQLYRTINYRSLVGKSQSERAEIIVDWARKTKRKKSPVEAKALALEQATPLPVLTGQGKLVMTPNLDQDAVASPLDLLEPVRQSRALCKLLLRQLAENRFLKSLCNDLEAYEEELPKEGTMASWGLADTLIASLQQVYERMDKRELPDGAAPKIEAVLALHEQCKTALATADVRQIEQSEVEIDGGAHGDAITGPVKALDDAASVLKDADLTEPSFDRTFAALANLGRDEAMPTMEQALAGSDKADGAVAPKATLARRKWVMTTLGIAERTYNLLGSTASLGLLPPVQAALAHLGKAIEGLMALIR